MRPRLMLAALVLASLPSLALAGKDPYDEMATKIGDRAVSQLTEKKIAVLPFDYLDGRKSQAGGAIAEELANRFVEIGKLRVIERSQIQKVLGEVKLASTGIIDESTAKQLKGLGVEAVVTGTLEDKKKGKVVSINVKCIKTDTLEVIAVARSDVDKTWQDEAPQAAPPPVAQGEEEQPQPAPYKRAYRAPTLTSRAPKGFFDIFLGVSGGTMDMRFENPTSGESAAFDFGGHLALNPPTARSYEWDGMKTNSGFPFGFRVGGFGDVVGGDFEMSFYQSSILGPQSGIEFHANDGPPGTANFNVDQFLKVFTFNLLSGDLFFRIPTSDEIYPYFGLGMGLTLNNVSSDYIVMQGGTTLSQTAPGFMFRIPFGLRMKLADNFGLFAEGRWVFNTFTYDRGFTGETDKITMRGFQFLGGLSVLF